MKIIACPRRILVFLYIFAVHCEENSFCRHIDKPKRYALLVRELSTLNFQLWLRRRCSRSAMPEYIRHLSHLIASFNSQLLNVSNNLSQAMPASLVSSSSCTNLLPMMQPAALACALSRVCLFDMPKPIMRGWRRFI